MSTIAYCCLATVSTSTPDLVHSAAAIEEWIINIRRELHMYPELMFQVRDPSFLQFLLNYVGDPRAILQGLS